MRAIRTHLVVIHGMILVEMKACGWYSPQTLLRVEQIDGDDLPAPRRTGSQISGARISSASKKPSILSGTIYRPPWAFASSFRRVWRKRSPRSHELQTTASSDASNNMTTNLFRRSATLRAGSLCPQQNVGWEPECTGPVDCIIQHYF